MEKIIARSFALFLALSLSFPSNPVLAFRPEFAGGLEESDSPVNRQLAGALRTGLEERRWGETVSLEKAKLQLREARQIEFMEVHLGTRGNEQAVVNLNQRSPEEMDGILEQFVQGAERVLLRPEGPTQIRILPAPAAAPATAGSAAPPSLGAGLEELPPILPSWISSGLERSRILGKGGEAMKQLRLESAEKKPLAHILYNEATVAVLFFLHVPPTADLSPNVAVVDPLLRVDLRRIAMGTGFSWADIEVWDGNYLVPYDPEIKRDIERATREAEDRIAQRLPGVIPSSIFSLPDALGEFGAQLKQILSSFGLTFQSGTLTDSVIEALYKVAQA